MENSYGEKGERFSVRGSFPRRISSKLLSETFDFGWRMERLLWSLANTYHVHVDFIVEKHLCRGA